MARVAFLAICFFVAFPNTASAHVLRYGTVSTELAVRGSSLVLQTELSQNIIVYGLVPDDAAVQYQKYFSNHIQISQNGADCPFTLHDYDPSFEAPHSRFAGEFICPREIQSLSELSIKSDLFYDAFYAFDHFLILTIGNDRYELPFSQTKHTFPGDVEARLLESTWDYFLSVSVQFIKLGVHHIWTGYDHILFLLSILLLTRSTKKILFVVTSFTLAHSITLILAGLHIVILSSRIVEPAIAATILFVTLRNIRILRSDQKVEGFENVPLAFGFGLIHGLGFAGALSETTIPQIFFVPALLTFNVGIELGQVALLAIALPLLHYLDKTPYRNRILRVFSYAVCTVAMYWILVRIFLY